MRSSQWMLLLRLEGTLHWQDIYIDAAAAILGEVEEVSTAVADGRYDAAEAALSRQRAATESRSTAPDLAVRAARVALRRSQRAADEIGLLIHAYCFDQGVDFWSVASYIQREVLGHGDALAFELGQMSNGGMCALEVAAGRLTAVPTVSAALLTTADCFVEPRFLRWSTDRGLVYGDAGTAAVLSRRPGPLRLAATATVAVPELEGLHRGDELHAPSPDPPPYLDLAARKRSFLARMPTEEVVARNTAGMLVALRRCLAELDADLDDMAVVVLPFFGAELLHRLCLDPLGLDPGKTLLEYGLGTGHLGAGDQFAGLAQLVEDRRLMPGDQVLLVGTGAGFNWSCGVVEVLSAVDE